MESYTIFNIQKALLVKLPLYILQLLSGLKQAMVIIKMVEK